MTDVVVDLANIAGSTGPDDRIRFRVPAPRPAVDNKRVLTNSWEEYPASSKTTISLEPGETEVQIVSGWPTTPVEIYIPASGTHNLSDLMLVERLWDEGDQERFLQEVRESREATINAASEAGASATSAQASVDKASSSASKAASSASAAKSDAGKAAKSASSASDSASAASTSADAATASEENAAAHASTAAQHEVSAKGYAEDAEGSAERAATIAGSTRWVGTQLEVNGKLSPELMPEITISDAGTWVVEGTDTGVSAKGSSSWGAITGKPKVFPPGGHKHKMEDITDLPQVDYLTSGDTIPRRLAGGQVRVADPTDTDHAATKRYADERDVETLTEARALVEARPAFFSGKGAPPESIPGAVAGDYYLNETTMELYKITEV